MPLNKPHVPDKETTSRPVTRDSDSDCNREQTQSSDSAATLQNKTSRESPPMVYAQLNVKQTQVQPPACDDPVQYAQIEH